MPRLVSSLSQALGLGHLTMFDLALRGALWLAIASLAMIPYWRALRRYRARVADIGAAAPPGKFILDVRQSDPQLERARWSCIRAGLFGVVMTFLLTPVMLVFLRS